MTGPANAGADRRPRRSQLLARYAGPVKAVTACAGAGYLSAMPLPGTWRLTAWAVVTVLLLADCAVVAVRGARPVEQEQHDEGNSR